MATTKNKAPKPLDSYTRLQIAKVLDYNWRDQLRDFADCVDVSRKTHIFQSLVKVRNWLDGTHYTAEDHVRKMDDEALQTAENRSSIFSGPPVGIVCRRGFPEEEPLGPCTPRTSEPRPWK